jgi:XisH protein
MARDIIHEPVKKAIENAGWTVTDDQYTVEYAEFTVYADLAAERLLAAKRGIEKIAVEIKSFVRRSPVQDVKDALGSYEMYRAFLAEVEPERKLYLAISEKAYHDTFRLEAVQLLIKRFAMALIVVDVEQKEVVEWIES